MSLIDSKFVLGVIRRLAATAFAVRKNFVKTVSDRFLSVVALTCLVSVLAACGNAGGRPWGGDQDVPTVVSSTPANGATKVKVRQTISVVMSEALDATTVTSRNVSLRINTPEVPAQRANVKGALSYDATTKTISFTPSQPMSNGNKYRLQLSGVADVGGTIMLPTIIDFKIFLNPEMRNISYSAGAVRAYNNYTYDANGAQTRTYTGAGTDAVWFTADDVVDSYGSTTYEANGNPTRDISNREVSYIGAGTDTVWFTADDVVRAYGNYTYDANGNQTRAVTYSGAGTDVVWFTADDVMDVVRFYANYTYDANGNQTRAVTYSGAGTDAIWFTADDVVNSYNTMAFDDNQPRFVVYSGAGTDTVWFTADDVVDAYGSETYDANGNKTRDVVYTGAGTDAVWFTADDLASHYNNYTYDANGNQTRDVHYTGAGTDTVWFTADDVIDSYFTTAFDTNDNRVSVTGYSAAGADGAWFTADDSKSYVWIYDTTM